jgi:hypothetical protein
MKPTMTSSVSESARGRVEQSIKPSLRSLVPNLIMRVRLWLDKLLSFPYARVVMIFVVGFAAGLVWDSYAGPVRTTIGGWSPYLAWVAPPAASASYDRVRADLVAARQSLDRLGNDINRLETQGANAPRRRVDR